MALEAANLHSKRLEMSLFKKPGKNFRRRAAASDDEEAKEGLSVKPDIRKEPNGIAAASMDTLVEKSKAKEKERIKPQKLPLATLSFEEEKEEEVFQVKKSLQSRRLTKQREKEKRQKKLAPEREPDIANPLVAETVESHEVPVKLEESSSNDRKSPIQILSGREAEMAKLRSSSDDSEEEYESTNLRYRQPDPFKTALKSGAIPDAALIHAARKRRQMARELGTDYIPVDDTVRIDKTQGSTARLVREDENDVSEDEERIDFAVNLAGQEKQQRKEAFNAAIQDGSESDSEREDTELERWESQQIQKGVRKIHLAQAHKESQYQQYSIGENTNELPLPSLTPVQPKPFTSIKMPDLNSPAPPPVDTILKKLRDKLSSLSEVHRRHENEAATVKSDIDECSATMAQLERSKPALGIRYRYFQELRGYVSDLIDCVDAKIPDIDRVEKAWLSLIRTRHNRLVSRRREDVKDQAAECNIAVGGKAPAVKDPWQQKKEEEDKIRRAAEREGRRGRRRRAREVKATTSTEVSAHKEGLSSDDEVTESENIAFATEKQRLIEEGRTIWASLAPEDLSEQWFTSLKRKIEEWKRTDPSSYKDAYVSLCLPKLFSPMIRLQLIGWSPMEDKPGFETMEWFQSLLLFDAAETEQLQGLSEDPDLLLISRVIEKVVVPRMTQLVEASWDPMSTTQTIRLVSWLKQIVQDYPTVGGASKPFQALLKTVSNQMKMYIQNDAFIPIYSHASFAHPTAVSYFQRQFWSVTKLLHNILRFCGLISDPLLKTIAIDSLIGPYLLLALRISSALPPSAVYRDNTEEIEKCRYIISGFPRPWLGPNFPILSNLQPMVRFLITLAQQSDNRSAVGKYNVQEVATLLQSIGAVAQSDDVKFKYLT